MTKDTQILIDALDKIAYTVKHLQEEAKAVGGQLDGIVAFQIADDPKYLKRIAADALDSYAGSAEGEKEEFGEWLERCCDPHSTSGKEPEKKDPWISVEDHPLVIDTKLGWECTEAGEGEFLAAIQVHDNTTNKDHWWIRHCVIEDMIGLCVVGDDENTPAGWDVKDVQYYWPLPEPPAATNQEGGKK